MSQGANVQKRPQVRVAWAEPKRLIDFAYRLIVSFEVAERLAQCKVSLGETRIQRHGSS